jgi:nucleotide-binding universal stress UspA family protein
VARIVVGVDGSEGSRKAVDWAVGEARLRAVELTLFHGWHVPASVNTANAAVPVALWNVLEDSAREIPHAAAENARSSGATVVEVLEQQHAAPALIDHAKGADLLVVGTRGSGWLLGTAARFGQPGGGSPRSLPGGHRAAARWRYGAAPFAGGMLARAATHSTNSFAAASTMRWASPESPGPPGPRGIR